MGCCLVSLSNLSHIVGAFTDIKIEPKYLNPSLLFLRQWLLKSQRKCNLLLVSVSEWSRSVLTDSLRPRGPTRLLRPWDSPGKNTGVGYHFLLQGIFRPRDLTQVSRTAGRRFNLWATREGNIHVKLTVKKWWKPSRGTLSYSSLSMSLVHINNTITPSPWPIQWSSQQMPFSCSLSEWDIVLYVLTSSYFNLTTGQSRWNYYY